MKLHHPDVAGPLSTTLAQQLNVARDWLAHPERRARYDASRRGRGPMTGGARRDRRPEASRAAGAWTGRRTAARTAPRHGPRFDPWQADFGPRSAAVRTFLRAVERLGPDAVARLSSSGGARLVDAIPGFVDEERRAALLRVELAIAALVPAFVRRDPAVVSAILGRAYAVALGDLVGPDELVAHLLSDAWDGAVGVTAA